MSLRKHMPEKPKKEFANLAVGAELHSIFRKVCIIQDMKPIETVEKLLAAWIDDEIRSKGLVIPKRAS